MILTEGSEGSGGGVWRRALESGETIESEDDDGHSSADSQWNQDRGPYAGL